MSDRSLSDRKRVTVTMQKGALENEGGRGGGGGGGGGGGRVIEIECAAGAVQTCCESHSSIMVRREFFDGFFKNCFDLGAIHTISSMVKKICNMVVEKDAPRFF